MSINQTLSVTAPLPAQSLTQGTTGAVDSDLKLLQYGIWAYFFLLIFEGALRKWFLPTLATPLLLARDPIALWLIVKAWQRGLVPATFYVSGTIFIGFFGIVTAVLLGHGNVLVALYGARTLLLHFPLIFIIGRVFNREDVIKMGKVTLGIAIPMVVLIALQFYSPQSAWVNRGVGGDMEGSGFSGALGYFRPSATFSFTNGATSFFSFVAPFVFFFWLDKKKISRLLLLGATGALLFSIPLSISRGLFFQVALSLGFVIAATTRKPENLWKMVVAVASATIVLTLLSQLSIFATATEAFTARFDSANEQEGGVEGVFLDRFLGGLIGALTSSSGLPFFGYGLGMGSNVGSQLLTGNVGFLIAEGEWGRLIGELGPLLGISMVLIRLGLALKFAWASYIKLASGDLLPWMLLSYGFLNIAQGGWAQPTSLGFCTLIGGLLIASFRPSQAGTEASPARGMRYK